MAEVIYFSSGDVREAMNAGKLPTANNYLGEIQLPGALITRGGRSATRYINGKLERVYPDSIPFTAGSVPVLIVEVANELAECWIRRKQYPGISPMSKEDTSACDSANQMLDDIADEKIELPELSASDTVGDVKHTRAGFTPVFDMDSVLDQEVDPELLEEIDSERND